MSLFGNKESYKNKKSLIIYFSRADENYNVGYIDKGNTEIIAEYIRDVCNADMFKVERKMPYSKDYMTCIKEAQNEANKNERPELVKYLDDISEYEVIYIGVPIYWGGMPMPMFTELERLDFTGKIVRVFTTHEGSGLSNVPRQVKEICKGADVKNDGLAIQGSKVKISKDIVENWI